MNNITWKVVRKRFVFGPYRKFSDSLFAVKSRHERSGRC